MERKTRRKLLAILLIITILATDFFILGSNLITYGTKIDGETNNPNVEFSAYFKNDKGQRIDSIEKSIKSEDLKLYAEVKVKNEGYFNGQIEIQDSNFNIKNEILSSNTHISSIEGNRVNLKQISHGETVEIELGISPIISDKIAADMLTKISIVKLNGSYTASNDSGIQYGREVSITFHEDELAIAELETDIITNKVFTVNGTNKRIIQLLIKSRLIENQYPVEQTILKVTNPQLSEKQPEEIKVLAIGKLATNGLTEITEQDWVNENGILQININNTPDSNNEIAWDKNIYDKLVVTYIYDENVNANLLNITTSSEIKAYNSDKKYKAESIENENQELNNIIMAEPEITTEEIYKGQLYANINATEKKDIQYNTKTTLVVINKDIANEIVVNEGSDVFKTDENELMANTKYLKTEINKNKMLDVLGQDGNITIKNGEKTITINKDTKENTDGNIVINYTNSVNKLNIITSKPENEGILEIRHTKVITGDYSRNEIKTIRAIKTMNSVEGTSSEEKPTEASLEIKDTTTKAELTVLSEGNLSTTETSKIKLGVTLITDGEQYDLYKNPTIKIQLPDVVENVVPISLNKQYTDEFKVKSSYNNLTKTVTIDLTGEQKEFTSSLTQTYLELNLEVSLSKLATTHTGLIKMMYENANPSVSQYYGETTDYGLVEKEISIVAPTGIMKWFNVSSNIDKSMNKEITQQITSEEAGETVAFELAVINNTNSDMKNTKILGKLPTTGNEDNTLTTTLKSIEDVNTTIYYTENGDATTDINNASNGWTTNLNELTNATLYLIELGTLAKGDNYTTSINVEMPDTIERKQKAYTQYEVIYDEGSVDSRKITLETDILTELELVAKVGGQELKEGSKVKEGEVIKYIATFRNTSEQEMENIELKANVPNGTVLVVPAEYAHLKTRYYEEVTDEEKIAEITSKTIQTLGVGESTEIEYEVRVKTDITTGTEISNQAEATYNNERITSDILKNILEESNIRVTINRLNSDEVQFVAGNITEYRVYIENLSNESISDLSMKIFTDEIDVKYIKKDGFEWEDMTETVTIGELSGNATIDFEIKGTLKENFSSAYVYTVVSDANTTYRSNQASENILNGDATITMTSNISNNEYIGLDDVIEYDINVTNTGEIDGSIVVNDKVPNYLKVEELSREGKVIRQSSNPEDVETYFENISNIVEFREQLHVGETLNFKIKAKVNYETDKSEEISIVNKADLQFMGVSKGSSEEITHILKIDILGENKINGHTWFDANENGQYEYIENIVENVKVKLYDVSTKSYVKETVNDSNGEYKFENVNDGTYRIIFEYDMNKYETTIYSAERVDPVVSSKAQIQEIEIDGNLVKVVASDEITLENDTTTIVNIGLKEKKEIPPVEEEKKLSISGYAWLDLNKNGIKDQNENGISGVNLKLYNTSTNNYQTNENGQILQLTTNSNGQYYFTDVSKGAYRVVFEYDTSKYMSTTANDKTIIVDGNQVIVIATDIFDVQEDIKDINIGLNNIPKDDNVEEDNTGDDNIGEDNTGDDNTGEDNTGDDNTGDDNTGDDNTGDDNTGEDNTGDDNTGDDNTGDDNTGDDNTGDDNTGDDNKGEVENTKSISGQVWLDVDMNGKKDANEKIVEQIKVILYNVKTKQYIKDNKGEIIEVTTDFDGKYTFNNVPEGSYIVLFEYDTEKYELATHNSNIVLKKINLNGKERIFAVTNTIEVNDNITNINIGLIEKLIFDLELNKYISRIVIQNSKETKTYDYKNETFAKVEIHRKQIQGSLVVLEYVINVKNNGEVVGYAKNIVDYLPKGLTFSSELNSDWYLSGDYLYTKSLENTEIAPGEEKEIKLILTKTMTSENVGLINNRAEIYLDYNKYGNIDIDSTPNNQSQNEDDLGSTDVIIGVSTGGTTIAYIILIMINIILIGVAIRIMIKGEIIKISIKKGGRK